LLFGAGSERPVDLPVLPVFRPCYSPVPASHLFLRYFNSFSCIRRVSAPCKSPVFCFENFSRAAVAIAYAASTRLKPFQIAVAAPDISTGM
jgi:hypothetical protein